MTKLAVITGRKEHAARINEAWREGVNAVIETGMRIIAARNGLDHGEYIAMVENDLHFKRSTAFQFVAIASNKTLSNVQHVEHLPAAVGTLYDLTVIANKGYDLEAGIEIGAIYPRMERKEVKALLPPPPQRDDDLEETEDEPNDDTPTAAASDWEAEGERLAARLIKLDREAARTLQEWITLDERRALKAMCRAIGRELAGTEEAAPTNPDRWSDR